jgi:hypothetical protein
MKIAQMTLRRVKETYFLPLFEKDAPSPIQLLFKFGQDKISLAEEEKRLTERFLQMTNGQYGRVVPKQWLDDPCKLQDEEVRIEKTVNLRIFTGDYHIPATFMSKKDYCEQFIAFYEAEDKVEKLVEQKQTKGKFTFNGCEQSDITKRMVIFTNKNINISVKSILRVFLRLKNQLFDTSFDSDSESDVSLDLEAPTSEASGATSVTTVSTKCAP